MHDFHCVKTAQHIARKEYFAVRTFADATQQFVIGHSGQRRNACQRSNSPASGIGREER